MNGLRSSVLNPFTAMLPQRDFTCQTTKCFDPSNLSKAIFIHSLQFSHLILLAIGQVVGLPVNVLKANPVLPTDFHLKVQKKKVRH